MSLKEIVLGAMALAGMNACPKDPEPMPIYHFHQEYKLEDSAKSVLFIEDYMEERRNCTLHVHYSNDDWFQLYDWKCDGHIDKFDGNHKLISEVNDKDNAVAFKHLHHIYAELREEAIKYPIKGRDH